MLAKGEDTDDIAALYALSLTDRSEKTLSHCSEGTALPCLVS